MLVGVLIFGSSRDSPPVDQIEPSGCAAMVCLRQSCSNSSHVSVLGSKRPSFLEPACATQIEPSTAGTAEGMSAGLRLGTRISFISPVCGLKCATRLEAPYCGIQNVPSLSGCAVQGERSGPGMS